MMGRAGIIICKSAVNRRLMHLCADTSEDHCRQIIMIIEVFGGVGRSETRRQKQRSAQKTLSSPLLHPKMFAICGSPR